MKKKIITCMLLMAVGSTASAQGWYESVLNQVEANSTTLHALRMRAEAQKIGSRTGIFLPNPEVEFSYMWGSPSTIGNAYDLTVKQAFDFPTAYSHRNKIAKLENANAELMYRSERMDLLLTARKICVGLIYWNAMAKEYDVRLANAKSMAETYKTRLDKGEAGVIESNKAQLYHMAVRNEASRVDIERAALLSELKRLNGGKDIAFTLDAFPVEDLSDNFDDWYAQTELRSPALQYLKGQIEINNQQTKLNRAMSLPRLSAGYIRGRDNLSLGQEYQVSQGFIVGMSIPLWENTNRVKQAKAQSRAAESILEDTRIQFYNQLQNLYSKSLSLQHDVRQYKESLSLYSNDKLLEKALVAGEMSLLSFLVEIQYYYDSVNAVLEAEKNLGLAVAQLSAVEL